MAHTVQFFAVGNLWAKAGGTPPILPQPLQELAADPRLELTELPQFKLPTLDKGSHLGKYLLFKFDIFFNTLDNLGFFSFFQPGIAEMISVLGEECVHHSRQNFLDISRSLFGAEDREITPAQPFAPCFPPHILRQIFSLSSLKPEEDPLLFRSSHA